MSEDPGGSRFSVPRRVSNPATVRVLFATGMESPCPALVADPLPDEAKPTSGGGEDFTPRSVQR